MKRKMTLRTLAAALLAISGAAHSAVIYQFSFSQLSGVTGGTGADFGITLTYAGYVNTTGLQALSGTDNGSLASLGYAVNHAGTNNIGWWAFDDDNAGTLSNLSYAFGGESFLFRPTASPGGYFSTPGTYAGSVSGNAPNSFSGQATLTIRDTANTVPEPAPVALLLLGLAGIAAARRAQRG